LLKYMLGLLLILISKSWGCPPPPSGQACLSYIATHAQKGRGLFIYARVFFPVWCHPWMDDGTDGRTDEWTSHVMKKASRKMTTTSFTICNNIGHAWLWIIWFQVSKVGSP
jgi:hypothetical protein